MSFLERFTEGNYQQSKTDDSCVEALPRGASSRGLRYLIIAFLVLSLCMGLLIYFVSAKAVGVPDFYGWALEDVKSWGEINLIKISFKEKYDETFPKGAVMEQQPLAGEKAKKHSTVQLLVSAGFDPGAVVGFVVEEGANILAVQHLITEKKLTNVQILFSHHQTIPEAAVIRVEYDDNVQPEKFRRRDEATVLISQGPYPKDISMPFFIGQEQQEVIFWHESCEFAVDFVFEPVYSDMPAGVILEQDIQPGGKISRATQLKFLVSRGRQILMPDYKHSQRHSFDLVPTNGLAILAMDRLSGTIPYGNYISQSVKAGKDMTNAHDEPIYVYYSLGKPFIGNLVGYTEDEIAPYFYNEFTAKGAKIRYSVVYDKEAQGPYGTVVRASKCMEFLKMDALVEIVVSKNRDY